MKIAAVPLLCVLLAAMGQAQTTVREWTATELGKWSSSHVSHKRVEGGVLLFDAEAADAMLVAPAFPGFAVLPGDRVEITMKSSAGGDCEIYWSGTTEGKFGGFSGEKRTPFVALENGWNTYSLEPFWHAEKNIIKFRLDFPHDRASSYALRSIRVVNSVRSPAIPLPVRSPILGTNGEWRAAVSVPLSESAFVSVRMQVRAGTIGALSYATDDRNGLAAIHFPLRPDGRMHTYNLDVGHSSGKERKGNLIELRLRPSDGSNAMAKVDSISAGSDVTGPADLEIAYFDLKNPYARAGRPEILQAFLRNHGSEAARGIKPRLELSGARVIAQTIPEQVEYGDPAVCTWTINAERAGPIDATLSLENAVTVTRQLSLRAAIPVKKSAYVPVPAPAKTEYQIGAYYFPGWNTAGAWSRLQDFPERQPLLGRYREGDPEVIDWQIKWAVEQGISFFLYDWYWDRGHRQLEHGLSALFQARYQHLMKFCLLYANHNAPGSHSAADFEAMTRFWIENYFRRTNYLQIEGKPVVVMFAPMNPAHDMGVPAVRASFNSMRRLCREAGLGGLYFVACMAPSAGMLGTLKDMGYDAVSAYNWPGINMTDRERQANRAPFSTAAAGYMRAWESIASENSLKMIPPICGGWDARPWHGEGTLVRTDRTPEAFQRHLEDCKRFLDVQEQAPKLKMAFIEAWNEWGEGSYIEPHRQYGFAYLEAVRKVFAAESEPPAELSPADLGLGPYDIPIQAPVTAWDFVAATNALGWSGNVLNFRVEHGVLCFTTRGNDPILTSPPLHTRAAKHPYIKMNVKASRSIDGQLFWSRSGEGLSEAASIHFPIKGDATFHEIKLRLAENPRWRGVINSLRLDPGSYDGVVVEIAAIELIEGD